MSCRLDHVGLGGQALQLTGFLEKECDWLSSVIYLSSLGGRGLLRSLGDLGF